jgi:hypothetical protein
VHGAKKRKRIIQSQIWETARRTPTFFAYVHTILNQNFTSASCHVELSIFFKLFKFNRVVFSELVAMKLFFVLAFYLAVAKGQEADEGLPHPVGSSNLNPEEEKAAAFIVDAEEQLRDTAEKHTFIEWAYESNINDENEKKKLEFQVFIFYLCKSCCCTN